MTILRRRAAFTVPLLVGLIGCGVPTGSDSFESIDNDVPARLAEASTTSSTTTTTTAPTTVPDTPLSTPVETTPTVPLEMVQIYFLSRGELLAVPQSETAPVTVNDLIGLLEQGPISPLRESLIAEGLINTAQFAGGIVTIDLDEDTFRDIPGRDQRLAIGQMVFTFVSNLDTVGLALFTFDGQPNDVPKGDRLFTDDPVSVDDYTNLLIEGGSPIDAAATTDPPIPGSAPTTPTDTSSLDTSPPDTSE